MGKHGGGGGGGGGDKVYIEIVRENSNINLNQTLDVLVKSIKTDQTYVRTAHMLGYLNRNGTSIGHANVSVALPHEDYEPVSQIVRFEPGEVSKKIALNSANSQTTRSLDSNQIRVFTIQLKPLLSNSSLNNLCGFVNPDYVNVVIQGDRGGTRSVLVGFNQSSLTVNETQRVLNVPVIRGGDLTVAFSVICHTRQLTAIENKDYMGRGSFEQSRIYFESDERVKYCPVELINDSVYEADETFQLKLTDVRVAVAASAAEILLGQFGTLTVTIANDEDASVISLSDEIYYTEEPSTSDSSVVKQITVIRSGDLSRVSLVRVSTVDETATAGSDYKPKTEVLQFDQGVSALDFEIQIYPDNERESTESFRIMLGPQDPVSGLFGKIKQATVLIQDNSFTAHNYSMNRSDVNSLNSAQNRRVNTNMPYVISLDDYIQSEGLSEEASGERLNEYAPNGKPLICIQVRFTCLLFPTFEETLG